MISRVAMSFDAASPRVTRPWRRMKRAKRRPRNGRKAPFPTSPRNRDGMPDPAPRRGEGWLIAFDPSVGGEGRKTKPAVVISNDTAIGVLNRVQFVPVSSQTERIYPAEAPIT